MKLTSISDIREYLKSLLKNSMSYEFAESLFVEDLEGIKHKIVSVRRNSYKGRVRLFDTNYKPYELSHLNTKSIIDNLNHEASLSNISNQNAAYIELEQRLFKGLDGKPFSFYVERTNPNFKINGITLKKWASIGYKYGDFESLKKFYEASCSVKEIYELKLKYENNKPDGFASAQEKSKYYYVKYAIKGNYKYLLASRMWANAISNKDPYPVWRCSTDSFKSILNIIEFFDSFLIEEQGFGFETANWLFMHGFEITMAARDKLLVNVPFKLRDKVKKTRQLL